MPHLTTSLTVLTPPGVVPPPRVRGLERYFDLRTRELDLRAEERPSLAGDGPVLVDLTATDEGEMAGFMDALEAAEELAPLVLLVRPDQEDRALEAVRLGAADYILGDAADPAALRHSLRCAAARSTERRRRAAELRWSEERLRTAQRDAHESEERFRALIEHSADVITIARLDGVLRYASPSTRRVLGHEPEELLGRSLFDLVHPDDVQATKIALRPALGRPDRVYGVTTRLRHRDGSWHTMQSQARNLLHHPAIRGFVVNSRDVTDHRELEEQLQRAQKMEAVGRLAGGVAHDFNNLITVVKGNAQLILMEQGLDGGVRARVREIDDASDRASSLTRQLLTFSRQEARAPEVVDLTEVADGTLHLLRRVIGEDVEVTARLESDIPVVADRSRMEQVLVNLAVNARDAMPRGGKLRIETRKVEMEEGVETSHGDVEPGRYAILVVSDDGCGMSLEVQRDIFDPFFTTKPEGEGTGLGLSTVWGIVRQADGHVHVYSEPGCGTSFRIYLPLADAKTRTRREVPRPAPVAGTPAPRTVLVVEDDPSVRRLVRTLLRRSGYEVVDAASGSEALRLAGERERPVDLLLSDVVMPGMTGPELAERLLERWPELRVLFTSGYSEAELRSRAHVLEHARFLEKPFDAADFVRAVARSMGRPDRD